MRPVGVTNHFSRIVIPNNPVTSDADFSRLIADIRATMMEAVDAVVTCEPGAIILGMSAETFWDGLEGSADLQRRIEARAGGRKVTMASQACQAALRAYGGDIRRISVITPYMPIGDAQVRTFFTECGFEIVHLMGLRCPSPTAIAEVSEKQLRDAIIAVNDPSVEAIVQVGTNLAMARVAALAEFWLDKPVIAINTATYWWALREHGIMDKVQGYGALLAEF
jgi:maleate isomerase